MRLCFGFTAANAAAAEATKMAARARRTRQLLGKEILGYKQCCPLHTNSRCGKERRILIGPMVTGQGSSRSELP